MSNSTHVLIIKGDPNDGDYITREVEYNPECPKAFIEANQFISNTPAKTQRDVVEAFIKAVGVPWLPTSRNHNWAREEFDDLNEANHTIMYFFQYLYGNPTIIKLLMDEDYDIDELLDEGWEFIQENFTPYGEFGIHTFSSVEIRENTPKSYLFQREEYWDVVKNEKNIAMITHTTPDGNRIRIDDNGDAYRLVKDKWQPAVLTYDKSHLIEVNF